MKDKTGWNKYRHKRKPVEPKEAELQIESLTNSGDGLGRLDERVVFVPYTLPGDRVRIKITQRKKTYALAEVIDIVEPGEHRREARCAYFERCGGCDWQHVPYSLQLDAKEQQLKDTLERIGNLGPIPIQPIVSGSKEFGYRNRIQGEIRGGQFHYKRRRSDQRIAISHCDIAEPAINDYLKDGLEDQSNGRVEIAVVDDTIKVVPVNEKNSTELGFRQVNTEVSELLSSRILSLVKQSQWQQIVDLYCGRGTWTNEIASSYQEKQLIGVDSSADNIRVAREESQRKKLTNIEFHQSPVEKLINKLPLESSLCIFDPPRAGLDSSICDGIIKRKPPELIYVSCHPATLARDLKLLVDGGYHVKSLLPLDMFPQTAHLESLVHLVLKEV